MKCDRVGELQDHADFVEAARRYKLAADKGHLRALIALSDLYDKGIGVAKNHEESMRLLALAAEQKQLLGVLEHYLPAWLAIAQQQGRWFSGLRPIVRTSADLSSASREADVQRDDRLLSVFGGKWTTARSLAEQLVNRAPFNGQP